MALVVPNDMWNWYESSLPSRERKTRGHFSTPSALIEAMLDCCGYVSQVDLSQLRVLDPACGSGNFLASAVRRLIVSEKRAGVDSSDLLSSVQRNIWGFDPDPIACFLAEMQVRTVLAENGIAEDGYGLHIHQADGLVLPWEQLEMQGGVDLFLANPPYLAAKNNDLSSYRFAHDGGQADSYLLFLRLALQVVRPNGWIGLVLPDPVLARANATRERQRLLEEMTVHHLWHLSGVFAAYVGAVVIVAQKSPPKRMHQIQWRRERWGIRYDGEQGDIAASGDKVYDSAPSQIPQSLLRAQPGAELRYLLQDTQETLVERLHTHLYGTDGLKNFHPLSRFVSIRRGEELGKKNFLLTKEPPANSQSWHPVLLGGVDVRPYEIPKGQHWIAEQAISKQLRRYLAPKLLIVKSTGILQATLDLQGHVVLQTLYLLNLREYGQGLDDLYFLLALLNSRLLRQYVYILHTAYKWVQPQLEQHVLARLPIPIVDAERKMEIIEHAKLRAACSKVPSVVELKEQTRDEALERAICMLYEDAIKTERQRS